ncbi:MAG: RnfABCDGE type electron transport complex subunit B, partial [Clostridia bacterium]|nr:RnfABCDGE type electron transport complex subunit B [Clostridia bacterium]
MNEVLLAVLIVAGIGLIVGVGLSVASALLAVKKDEKEEAIRACLPGANCGACGFSGCDGYAAALAKGEAESVSLCAPGGADTAKALGALLGKEAEEILPTAAVVR